MSFSGLFGSSWFSPVLLDRFGLRSPFLCTLIMRFAEELGRKSGVDGSYCRGASYGAWILEGLDREVGCCRLTGFRMIERLRSV
jgi:hypothetical protein